MSGCSSTRMFCVRPLSQVLPIAPSPHRPIAPSPRGPSHRIASHHSAAQRIVVQRSASQRTALHRIASPRIASHTIPYHCSASHCIVWIADLDRDGVDELVVAVSYYFDKEKYQDFKAYAASAALTRDAIPASPTACLAHVYRCGWYSF